MGGVYTIIAKSISFVNAMENSAWGADRAGQKAVSIVPVLHLWATPGLKVKSIMVWKVLGKIFYARRNIRRTLSVKSNIIRIMVLTSPIATH